MAEGVNGVEQEQVEVEVEVEVEEEEEEEDTADGEEGSRDRFKSERSQNTLVSLRSGNVSRDIPDSLGAYTRHVRSCVSQLNSSIKICIHFSFKLLPSSVNNTFKLLSFPLVGHV